MSRPPARERVLDATITCVGRTGLERFTVEDVAREAGVGRATVYRHFPDGRDQVLSEATAWEVGRFFLALADQVDDAPDLRTRLERGLTFAHRALGEHEVYQSLQATEGDRLLVRLADVAPITIGVVRGYVAPFLDVESLRPGTDRDLAADYLARMILSHLIAPGHWDLSDETHVRILVDTVLLGGILEGAD